MTDRLKGLAASLAIALILFGLPAALWAVGVPTLFTRPIDSPLDILLRPDDGSLVLAVLWVLGCLVWLVFTLLVLAELAAGIRRVQLPKLTGLGLPQSVARQLVGTAALLFVATSSIAPAAHAANPVPAAATTVEANDDPEPDPGLDAGTADANQAPAPTASTRTYVVQPGDSLWRIAERHLDAGDRYPEIVALNTHLLAGGPDFLHTGWQLHLPAETTAQPRSAVQVTVAAGDTLSELADTHLGDPSRWPDIYAASTAIAQPDGRRLTDPDQIDIGWTLNIPQAAAHADANDADATDADATDADAADAAQPAEELPEPESLPAEPAAPADPTSAEPTAAAAPVEPTAAASDPVGAETEEPATPDPATAWLVPGLSSGGLLLGALAVGLATRRVIQARYRRPGKAIPAVPAELAPIEKTVAASPAAAATVQTLDRILRWTATGQLEAGEPVPPVVYVDTDAKRITLHLAEEGTLIAPWLSDATGKHWTLRLSDLPDQDALTADCGSPAWPQLVTIGTSDTGATWLLNAEEVGTIRLTGDPTYTEDLARYLVAEFALNPWARDVRVDCLNTCAELTRIDPSRVHHHTDPTAVSDALAEALNTVDRLIALGVSDLGDARTGDAGEDLWGSRAVIVADPATTGLDTLMDTIASRVGRTGTSVILTSPTPGGRGMEVHLTDTGRVQLLSAGLDLIAVGLTHDEAAGCADLIAVADQPHDEDVPPMEIVTGQDTWRGYANQAGQITDPRITARTTDEDGTPSSSILPEPDHTLLDHAAVTIEDLATLAPTIPDKVAVEVETIDATLDADLAEWRAGDGPRPRLGVLGTLTARTGAGGNPHAVVRRRPYFTELLAYLASRPNGATTLQVADAMGIDPKRVRHDLSSLRDWLGKDPGTGQPHVPQATQSNAAKRTGASAYEVNGLLYDADLFRRLRLRGEARGPHGLDDLTQALALVNGRPFDGVRRGAWLVDQGLQHYLTIAIVDVSHLISTIHLARGNHRAARAAAETAILAAPHEQIPRLDLAAAVAAQGLTHQARQIAQATLDGDGDEPPLELSRRADEILNRHGWLDHQAS